MDSQKVLVQMVFFFFLLFVLRLAGKLGLSLMEKRRSFMSDE